MIENDKYLQSLGMRETAIRTVETLESAASPQVLEAMKAYLEGVNAFIATKELPFEYRLINAKPEPFTLRDVYCATGFMAYSFAIHLKTEPILDWMKTSLDSSYISDLAWGQAGFTTFQPVTRPVTFQGWLPGACLGCLAPRAAVVGFERWVLSGDRTASGEVIFCNDAHMSYASPSVWYEAHIMTPDLEYYGNHIGGHRSRPSVTRITPGLRCSSTTKSIFTGRPSTAIATCTVASGCPLEITTEVIEVAGEEPVEFEVRKPTTGPCSKMIWRCGGRSITTRKTAFMRRLWVSRERHRIVCGQCRAGACAGHQRDVRG